MVNRYNITVDRDLWFEWWFSEFKENLEFNTLGTENDDLVITRVLNFVTEEDVTIEIITEYSNWYGAQGTR